MMLGVWVQVQTTQTCLVKGEAELQTLVFRAPRVFDLNDSTVPLRNYPQTL